MQSCRPSIATLVASAERIINILVTLLPSKLYKLFKRKGGMSDIHVHTQKDNAIFRHHMRELFVNYY